MNNHAHILCNFYADVFRKLLDTEIEKYPHQEVDENRIDALTMLADRATEHLAEYLDNLPGRYPSTWYIPRPSAYSGVSGPEPALDAPDENAVVARDYSTDGTAERSSPHAGSSVDDALRVPRTAQVVPVQSMNW